MAAGRDNPQAALDVYENEAVASHNHGDILVYDGVEFYSKRRSQNVGLVITGCTYVTPSGIGFTHEFAAYDDRFINSLEKLAAAAKSGGAPAILQIFHAGNKAIPELVPNNDVISASASSVKSGDFMKRVVQSREMTENEIQETIRAFGDVTKRAIKAGFDGVELHGGVEFYSNATIT